MHRMDSIANGVFGSLQRPRGAYHAKEAVLIAANLDAPPMYREGDWLGAALAYVSLMPAFHLFWRGSLLYYERNWHQLEDFLGAGGNAVFSKFLKRLVKIERPAATCEELGLCGDLGMPSTHSQIMAFAWANMVLQMRAGRHPRHPGSSRVDAVEFTVLTACVAAVAWSRIYLGYHDGSQVCAGLAAGVATAVVWRWVVEQGWIRGVLQSVFQSLPGAKVHRHTD